MLVLAGLLAVPDSSAAKAVRLHLRPPGPGQTTVAVAQWRFKGRAPRAVRPKLLNPARLPPSCRGLYAIYRKHRGRTTTITFLTLVLRKEGAPAGTARESGATASVEVDEGFFLAVFFVHFGLGPKGGQNKFWEVFDSPSAPQRTTEQVLSTLATGGAVLPGESRPADLGDNLLDTGHYDDGHAFGWNSAGTKKAIGDWLHLTADDTAYEQVIERIEQDLSADLNGDEKVAGKTGGGSIGTTVGPPIITRPFG